MLKLRGAVPTNSFGCEMPSVRLRKSCDGQRLQSCGGDQKQEGKQDAEHEAQQQAESCRSCCFQKSCMRYLAHARQQHLPSRQTSTACPLQLKAGTGTEQPPCTSATARKSLGQQLMQAHPAASLELVFAKLCRSMLFLFLERPSV